MSPQSDRPIPYCTLLGFGRYVGHSGPGKATYVRDLRRQRESGAGFNPHGQLVKALKADIQFRTGGSQLAAVVEVVNARWRPLYQTLCAGAQRYLESLGDPQGVWLTQTREAVGMLGGLAVKVNPHLGLRYEGDRPPDAVRLYFDPAPPRTETVLATLHLMARHMDAILPGAEPVLVDLRRGAVHRADPALKPDAVEGWLVGEAAAFSSFWGTAA
ncbi:MAG TPA: hypothetical protein VFR67_10945 [Pilimelia sp.]|nr:hypothetical protein [Pilimelia sp.]